MKKFQQMPIRSSLVRSLLCIALVPLLVFEIIFYVYIYNKILTEKMEESYAISRQLVNEYQNLFEQVTLTSDNLAEFRPLTAYLEIPFSSQYACYQYYISNIHPVLKIGDNVERGVKVCIHHNREEVPIFSSQLHNDMDTLLAEKPELVASNDQAGIWNTGRRTSFPSTSAPLRYYYQVYDWDAYPAIDWVIEFRLTEDALTEPLQTLGNNEDLAFLTSDTGYVLAASKPEYRSISLEQDILQLIAAEKTSENYISIDGIRYHVFAQDMDFCTLLYLRSAQSIWQEQFETTVVYLIICLITAVLILLVIRKTADAITNGITNLAKKMQNFDQSKIKHLASEQIDRHSRNEIVQLDAIFTDMMANIDNLITTVSQKEIALRDQIIACQEVEISRIDAESRALQHQINPHYLFNTLEAIRMKLILKDDRETAQIIRLFAESFRRYMEDHDAFVPLREELEFVEKFIRIQNYRFDNQIHYICRADTDLLHRRILKLMIQPLVENAILHGLALQEQHGTICLTVSMKQDILEIIVEDDGAGMTQDELDALNTRIQNKQEKATSIGLPNIIRRARLVYGTQAELTISSKPGQGTRVTLLIPWKE